MNASTSSAELAVRWCVAALGVAAGLYGGYVLWAWSDPDQLVSAAIWLGAGVAAHDALVALMALLLVGLAVRLPVSAARTPTVAAFVVLGPLTLIAIPFLGRFGAKADNPTLLDRPYVAGFLIVVGLAALAVVVASVWRARRGFTDVTDPD